MIQRVASRWLHRVIGKYVGPESEVVYTAVFLSPMDRQRLLRRFGQAHPQVHAHHMTIWTFQDGGEPNLEALPLGKTVDLKIIGYVEDDNGQAVVIRPPTRLRPVEGRIPHITISTTPGTNPVYSNAMLRDFDPEQARRGFPALEGKVGWWDGSQTRFDFPSIG